MVCNTMRKLVFILFLSAILVSCSEVIPEEKAYELQIPSGFDMPQIPEDNILTDAKIALGKKLFYSTALSVDSTISCASCHRPENAFADHLAISHGVMGRTGFRNAPSLQNVAWYTIITMDGGNPSLETQPYVPIETHEEMGFNMVLLCERLNTDAEMVTSFNDVFGSNPDPYGVTRALAAFERTMISGNSRYDQYAYQGNIHALTAEELQGKDLFFSDALGCANCHSGFLFTNNTFENNGFFSDYSADSGRARITWLHEDVGKFKVPSLRNVGVTAPYMHNGQVETLDEIIDMYAAGGSGHENQSGFITGFSITPTEKEALIAFLLSLTDISFMQNPDLLE